MQDGFNTNLYSDHPNSLIEVAILVEYGNSKSTRLLGNMLTNGACSANLLKLLAKLGDFVFVCVTVTEANSFASMRVEKMFVNFSQFVFSVVHRRGHTTYRCQS